MEKSKRLQFFGNALSNIDRDINLTKNLKKLPMAHLAMYNGSNGKEELQIWESLKEPLHDFLLEYYAKQKEKIYVKIKKELAN